MKVDYRRPVFPALCLMAGAVSLYGTLRTGNPEGITAACFWFFLAWADVFLWKTP